MIGTLINIATVLVGGVFGLLFGSRLSDRFRETVIAGLGLFVLGYGLSNFIQTKNPLIVLGSVLVGSLLGEWWKIEAGLQKLAVFLETRYSGADKTSNRFVRGFLVASILFCVGPMTILGSLQNGLSGNYSILATKAVLDGFAALAFTSTLGVGVMFSVLVILVYQGGISLLAAQLNHLITTPMMTELTATGGILLVGIAISSLLEIKHIRMGNFLPALIIAPLIVAVLAYF